MHLKSLLFNYPSKLLTTAFISLLIYSTHLRAEISSFEVTHLNDPMPVSTTDKNLLVYELQFINHDANAKKVGLIEISDQNGNLLASYFGTKLLNNFLAYQDKKPLEHQSNQLKKGMGAFAYIWIELDKSKSIPNKLQHRIWLVSANQENTQASVETIEYNISVNNQPPIVLGSPLKGANWVASGAPSATSYHRRTILPIDGKFYLAQRFAIDWEQVCDDGKSVHGNLNNNNNWNAFGHPVYASASGIVSKVNDQQPENIPPTLPSPPLEMQNVPGNYVIIETAWQDKKYYVLHAHMQPGTLKVKVGDKVEKGQEIGLVGNTGNSSAPHLHVHVCDANESLKCEGVPFVFESVSIAGTMNEIDMDYGLWQPLKQLNFTIYNAVIPTINQLINFDDEQALKCKNMVQ